ncbi:MAG: hypothetical protein ACREV6_20515 [Clostridium sp.]|uniref:hypothetical protein n=1 Tax=Clostridium sp. TaxID=1506 RepID=UPI003D6D66D3
MLIIQNEILGKITPQKGVYIDFEPYQKMIEEMEDLELYALAMERENNETDNDSISQEEVMKKYGITQEDIDNCEDVEIEQ